MKQFISNVFLGIAGFITFLLAFKWILIQVGVRDFNQTVDTSGLHLGDKVLVVSGFYANCIGFVSDKSSATELLLEQIRCPTDTRAFLKMDVRYLVKVR